MITLMVVDKMHQQSENDDRVEKVNETSVSMVTLLEYSL